MPTRRPHALHPSALPSGPAAPAPPGRSSGGRAMLGALGEQLAAEHMQRRGFTVLARNVRSREGEIDLIACDGHTLAFVEVKTRRARPGGARSAFSPLDAIGPRKRLRLRRLAARWLAEPARRRQPGAAIRMDAIAVIVDRDDRLVGLEHLEGAW